ncbi:MAG: hypothetical protein Q9M39_05640 [Sulfurovum sp.]|nr:hypothetical protein [Sulfurovum sp.]
MSWKKYQNELIVFIAFTFMFMGYGYKQTQMASGEESALESRLVIEEIKEVIALKKIWSDKKITQKVNKIKSLIPEDKMKWKKTSKKVTASYKGLNDKELNTLVSKILNLPIIIKKLHIKNVDFKHVDSAYDVEFKCQW